jgi:multicomponent Na+:H+ antiporter subunit G
MDIKTIITGIFLTLGCFFVVVASIGIVRFPDFYSRMHPAGKSDTLGQMLILMGLMIYEGFSLISIKLFIIVVFIFIVNPTATHALAKAAYIAGVKPWMKDNKETT